ncbi:ATP synthase F1, gamma subunit [Nautilia profundicola AmH]|uniref:ATP synthase gamma chain n=1 Tax=Nautilia profundicola (strain ATCC BAA-1463 / DSM 18972 / AmH) TaxID=598659 RepID=ATPG_NAUPA|nr:ATP synthase F1 subunit gamma [Nautilia profundicola]B9L7Y6.1 RecName: Full=ATP synthase gamma chain; AltName: Full=ATP synthase F1 sector gamma subunit; AltName: Full=F-ATPase gamma subunit [Nautilia profundicola AmH]ACM92249.1 ATP synthase F1, gamma subunit [Nautilia profundicola AmH]
MATLKELKQKISSVKNTQKTTRAMKLVSTAKLKRAEEAIMRSREYARKIDEVMHEISAKLASVKDSIELRAFAKIENVEKVDVIVITADKGLCGGFNIQTIKQTIKLIEELKEKKVKIRLKVIGKKAIEYFKFVGIDMYEEVIGLSAAPNYEKAAELIQKSYEDFVNEEIDNIITIHNGYVNKLTQQVYVKELLPIEVDVNDSQEFLEVEPDNDYETILETLVKKYIEYSLYYALLDSLAAEHSARMQAMDAATNNAKEMVHQLTLEFNKARQEAVTRELIEIVTAIEAMKK